MGLPKGDFNVVYESNNRAWIYDTKKLKQQTIIGFKDPWI